jgi:hypothetical protein
VREPLGAEFREFAFIFVPRNGIPICFLFRAMSHNGIPRLTSLFVPQYRIPSIFLLCGMVRIEFREISVPRNSRNKPTVLSIPSSAEFLSEIANPCHVPTFPMFAICIFNDHLPYVFLLTLFSTYLSCFMFTYCIGFCFSLVSFWVI